MTVPTEAAARPLAARDARLEPWRAFLEAHARVTRRLDEELRAEHDLSLAEYDTLLAIAWAPDRRIRMRSLAGSIRHCGSAPQPSRASGPSRPRSRALRSTPPEHELYVGRE